MKIRKDGVSMQVKCLYCGEEVKGIGMLDIPYHIDCALKAILKNQGRDTEIVIINKKRSYGIRRTNRGSRVASKSG